jgi:hypothetical protein
MKITVEVKNVWGQKLIYPVCRKAKLFCQLAGKKTFSSVDIKIIEDLGYTVSIKVQELSEILG